MAGRLMIYDRTDPRLAWSWWSGARLYRALGRLDAWRGVSSWSEGLEWLATHDEIREIHYWGHGHWGCVLLNDEVLDASALAPRHALHGALTRIRARMAPEALWWFRTCETFGTERGHDFARRWTRFFERRAAGHTYVIGPLQSGLHSLAPGDEPSWSAREGVGKDGAALWSAWGAPNTISCFSGSVPPGW